MRVDFQDSQLEISSRDISRSENLMFRNFPISIISSLENIAGWNIPYISTPWLTIWKKIVQ
ncbi:hypothetical protein AUF78_10185 [archaeon 13_1_20CM_2_51_12]|nr:MAG: hypothetical protein AUF78_10185 [archaeon 13_1_20CM_2_51_12]